MNIFLRELKSHRLSLLFWSLGMIALVASGMAKFAAYHASGQSMADLVSQFPRIVQIIFGLSGFDLGKASGFYGVLFIYIALMATVHSVLLGTGLISKEERDRTSEFLFVKPITRATVVTAKLLAGLVNILILNLVTLLSSIYFVNMFNKNGESVTHVILVLTGGLLILQLLFFAIGAVVAAMSHKPKSAPSIATAILLFTFILSFLVNINDHLANLKYLTPFKYFDAHLLISNGSLDPLYVIISCVLMIIIIILTYASYSRRDLSV